MMYGGFGPWMLLMPLLWLVLLGLIVWAVYNLGWHRSGRYSSQDRRETPDEILDRRLAQGEIDIDAYQKARAALAERHRGPR
jgi:putative membrane protein